ncbi:hypothetical protein ACJJTC_004334 [Scirpophaga incertulas]
MTLHLKWHNQAFNRCIEEKNHYATSKKSLVSRVIICISIRTQAYIERGRLFIDGSKRSLKAVLLHNGNKLPSVPVAYGAHLKETYDILKHILEKVNYEEHKWHVCADLKVVALILGLQTGYTKYCCFLCEWDSRARSNHFIKQNWPLRSGFVLGQKNVINEPLVPFEKIILPPLHIKLGLMKNFVKALPKDGPGFLFLKTKFPMLSEAKIKRDSVTTDYKRKAHWSEKKFF